MNAVTDSPTIDDIAIAAKPSWNPLRCTGTDLPTNLTVMVKALAIVIVLTHGFGMLPTPWLPFIPWINDINPTLFQRTLQATFIISVFLIIFNRTVRWGALILGATILAGIVSSKTYYGNNRTFVGLILFLAGCWRPNSPPWIRWQLALTYFGAGINKAMDPDWHSGVFFDYWANQRLHEPVYMWLRARISPIILGKFFCWYTIFSELGVVPFLLAPSQTWFYWGVLANILFQCSLLLFVGNTFSLFWYGMNAASLAFVTWPTQMSVLYSDRFPGWLRKTMRFVDVDHRTSWEHASGALKLTTDQKSYTGARALRMIILFNPLTYFFIGTVVALDSGNGLAAIVSRRIFVGLLLITLLPPLAWCWDKCFGGE